MEVHACSIRACLESDVVVGSALIEMYSKCGRVDYASRFFELMPSRNVYSWNSMISGCPRHGHGHKALKLFERMKLHGQPPDHVEFMGTLSACNHVDLVDEGLEHFNSMSDRTPMEPNILIWWTVSGACGRANGRNTDIGGKAGEMLMELEPQNAVNYVLLSNMYASGKSGKMWQRLG
ncbi:hypothetical protein FNV43_RR12938 [Rhamnella rubrinervis]|uniref:Pentatricopeptide repeat-containing protein n=1 Tax=Rhamnella rubrinervis TaxID=2594499 RepID=A0A8K0MEH1_9ROSA|nr:hypothetical protein FNV43_RR12938 [Rhamnella rubrinervis]